MAILQGLKRVNPLDLNKNVTIGVAFPLDETNMFAGTKTIKIFTQILNVFILIFI